VLIPQLDRLAERNTRRLRGVRLLGERLRSTAGLWPFRNRALENSEPGYYKLGVQFDAERFGLDRERFVAAVRAEGVALDEGFRALQVGRSPSRWRATGPLTQAERAHHETVVLHHPVLLGADADIEEVVRAIAKIHTHAERLR